MPFDRATREKIVQELRYAAKSMADEEACRTEIENLKKSKKSTSQPVKAMTTAEIERRKAEIARMESGYQLQAYDNEHKPKKPTEQKSTAWRPFFARFGLGKIQRRIYLGIGLLSLIAVPIGLFNDGAILSSSEVTRYVEAFHLTEIVNKYELNNGQCMALVYGCVSALFIAIWLISLFLQKLFSSLEKRSEEKTANDYQKRLSKYPQEHRLARQKCLEADRANALATLEQQIEKNRREIAAQNKTNSNIIAENEALERRINNLSSKLTSYKPIYIPILEKYDIPSKHRIADSVYAIAGFIDGQTAASFQEAYIQLEDKLEKEREREMKLYNMQLQAQMDQWKREDEKYQRQLEEDREWRRREDEKFVERQRAEEANRLAEETNRLLKDLKDKL